MKAWLIPISLALLGGPAYADQCAWIEADIAKRAKTLLAQAPLVIEYCEPCGDKAPGIPIAATSVEIQTPSAGFRELVVNGKPVDLAYLFVKTDGKHYRNMAALAGCPATGVSPSLSIDSETDTGVLISADDDRLPEPPPPPPPPVTDFAQPPPPVAPQTVPVYYYSKTVHDLSWSMMALAACFGFLFGIAATLGLFAVRRRRSHKARATDL